MKVKSAIRDRVVEVFWVVLTAIVVVILLKITILSWLVTLAEMKWEGM